MNRWCCCSRPSSCWWWSSRSEPPRTANRHATPPQFGLAPGGAVRRAYRLREPVPVLGLARAGCAVVRLSAAALAALVDVVRPRLQPARLPAARRAGVWCAGAWRHVGAGGVCAGSAGGHAAVVRDGDLAEPPAAARRVERRSRLERPWRVARRRSGLVGACTRRSRPLAGRARPLVHRAQCRCTGLADVVAGGSAVPVAGATGDGADAAARAGGDLAPVAGHVCGAVVRGLGRHRHTALATHAGGRVGVDDPGAAGTLPVGVLGGAPRVAAARSGARCGGPRGAGHDAFDRTELRPRACAGLGHAAGAGGTVLRRGRGRRAEPPAAARGGGARAGCADGARHCGGAGAVRPVLRAKPARLGAGPVHPLPWCGALGRLAVAVCGDCLSDGAGLGARCRQA